MNSRTTHHLLASALMAMASPAFSQASPPVYGEIGMSLLNYQEKSDGDVFKAEPRAFRLIAGAELGSNLSFEVMLGVGGDGDVISVNGTSYSDFTLKIESMYGFYLKPRFELVPNVEVFGRLGYSQGVATATITNFASATSTEKGMSYGMGLRLKINPKVSFNIDYMSYLDKTEFTTKGVSFGLGYHF
jgi:opacity protein-like surface antigen